MTYSEQFTELLEKYDKQNQYVGLGNPRAKILFIGKEPADPIGSTLHGFAQSWVNKNDYSKRFIPDNPKLYNYNHTWQKYQKLYEKIIDGYKNAIVRLPQEKYEITFVENIFTTELSNLPAPNTRQAKEQDNFQHELENRKKIFWKDDFIKQFPIVVITAADNQYIETYRGEVCELFDVEFSNEYICSSTSKLWVHFAVQGKNEVFPKLVIHTRQLTNGATEKLIAKIAELIRVFIREHAINIYV